MTSKQLLSVKPSITTATPYRQGLVVFEFLSSFLKDARSLPRRDFVFLGREVDGSLRGGNIYVKEEVMRKPKCPRGHTGKSISLDGRYRPVSSKVGKVLVEVWECDDCGKNMYWGEDGEHSQFVPRIFYRVVRLETAEEPEEET